MIPISYKAMATLHFVVALMCIITTIEALGTIWAIVNAFLAGLNVWFGFQRLEGK